MKTLTLPAPAKLNLMLHLVGRRADGYHLLQSVFQFLDLADELHFQRLDADQLELKTQLAQVKQEDNLIWKAVQLLAPLRPHPKLGVSIQLEKRLPMGGGLGAGSSDAATTLLALNQLWELNLSLDYLAELGLQLGADVPVFVRGQTAWAEGIGEQLEPLSVPAEHYLLIHPGCHCSTAELFQHPDLPRSTAKISKEQALDHLGSNDFTTLARRLYPALDSSFHWLEEQQLQPWLTGTGACVFAHLKEPAQGHELLQQLPESFGDQPLQGWVVKGCQLSPAHQALI
ncbi:4-diphosphocytidyl-2-C-methyl-D-erythritol kinase [Marinospirillum celere]|uniref:4-diphosphocytidyl-2-C-methyl-D-erythritol kinase n=1 Tax=Marinospirillum celere TaxID=1122252 RepID=A0A1I1FVL6_9GAMM|nr:4-(cytidine 5'-diphospho)-2-C-methyl-D-erythritol kinase [Marinospirillum celere]SFC03321.1 4-diphosphocytidyl-2-C-methyl-D-erythritol kinase [Marinospirillum celere]